LDPRVILTEQHSGQEVSFVIAADKNLGRDRFLRLATYVAEKSGIDRLWIQVWGVHPYPLQIPIDLGDQDTMSGLEACQDLQEIVDHLCEVPFQDAVSKRTREPVNENAEQDGGG
jgi:hypothetical protein